MPRSAKGSRSNNEDSSDTESNSDNNALRANGRAYTPNNYPTSPPPNHNQQQPPQLYPNIANTIRSTTGHPINSRLGSPIEPNIPGGPMQGTNGPSLGVGQKPPQHMLQQPTNKAHHQYGPKYGQNLPPRHSPHDGGDSDANDMSEEPPYYVQDLPRTRTLGESTVTC